MIKRYKQQEKKRYFRINERIYAHELRVLDPEGKQIGILKKFDALAKAKELELDLVEVAPTAKPPVARIIDFKKFLYQEEKKKREEKRKSKKTETKQVRLGPFISENDLSVMERRVREFIKQGDKVRLIVRFRGRQITRQEFGFNVINKITTNLSDVSKIDREAHLEGRQLIAVISPDNKRNESKEVKTESKKISPTPISSN